MTTVFHTWAYGRFIEIQSNIRRKKLHRTKTQHLERSFFLKNRPIHFQINRTIVIRLVKQNQLRFPSTEINKPFLTQVHSVSQIRLKFRSQFKLLPQIRILVKLRIKKSIISIDSNITDNIITKVINVQQEKCKAKNGALSDSSINWTLF